MNYQRCSAILCLILSLATLLVASAHANPILMPHAYLVSERLVVTLSPREATLRGEFVFQQAFVSTNKLEILVWFPQKSIQDPTVAQFWKAFKTDVLNHVDTPLAREAFQSAIGLKVSCVGQEVPLKGVVAYTKRYSKSRIPEARWEAGYHCVVCRFDLPPHVLTNRVPVSIAYRQPLLSSKSVRQFFYCPILESVPSSAALDPGRFEITVAASPECSLDLTNGKDRHAVAPGQKSMLRPKHHQPIRAIVKSAFAGK